MTESLFVDLLGWIGALCLLAGYGLVSRGRVEGDSLAFQSLNVGGAGILSVNTVYYGAYPATFLNLVWVAIGLYALVRTRRTTAQ